MRVKTCPEFQVRPLWGTCMGGPVRTPPWVLGAKVLTVFPREEDRLSSKRGGQDGIRVSVLWQLLELIPS